MSVFLGMSYLINIIFVILTLILSTIIICFIRKRLIKKDHKFRILIYVIIVIFCGCLVIQTSISFLEFLGAVPDEQYIEMCEINDNQSLIGLSKEQVVELLGEPKHEYRDTYDYNAGRVTNKLFFGERTFYVLRIVFNENDIVKFTSIETVT